MPQMKKNVLKTQFTIFSTKFLFHICKLNQNNFFDEYFHIGTDKKMRYDKSNFKT